MTVPYSFATATAAIPLSQLDSNFNTTITLGNTAIQLGNTVTTLNNMTLNNVSILSGNVTITNVSVTTANVTTLNATTVLATTANVTTANITTGNVTFANITGENVTTSNVTTLTVTNNPTFSGGTANGVLYLNGSKVATSGSALTFDGTDLATTGAVRLNNAQYYYGKNAAGSAVRLLGINAGNVNYVGAIDSGPTEVNYGSASSVIAQYWNISGSEQMRLTSTGLGIGTSSPTTKLHIKDSTGTAVNLLRLETPYSNPSGNKSIIWTDATDTLGRISVSYTAANGSQMSFGSLYNNGYQTSDLMVLNSSGNLGLGVTPSAWAIYKAVEIGQVGNAIAGHSGAALTYISAGAYFNTTGTTTWKYATTGNAVGVYEVGSAHKWYTAASGTAGNAISFTQAMTLDASGNLGVGTTSPTYKVDLGWTDTSIGWYLSSSYSASISLGSGARSLTIATKSGDGADFIAFKTGTSSTERARIDSSGNLLVGTTSNNPAGTVAQFVNQWNGGSKWGASFNQTVSSATSYTHINFSTNGTTVGSIGANNSVTTYNTSSDYRLKDNPQPLTGSGAFIDALQPKTWNWKADGSKGVGFIAHEVQEVSPSSVIGEKDGEQMQAMEYGSAEFIANIIAELQSLRKRVAQLEGK